jgi:hypothetical protein
VSDSFQSDPPPAKLPDAPIQPAQGRPKSHPLADMLDAPAEAFAHRWGHLALREALLFLLVAAVVLVVCGLVLPVPGKVFWLLVLIVVGTGTTIGAAVYLFNVVPRLLRAWIVNTYSSMPRVRRVKHEKEAFGRGFQVPFIISVLLGIGIPLFTRRDFALLFLAPAMGAFFGFMTGFLWLSLVRVWNYFVDRTLRQYSLSPPVDLPPDDYADTISKPTESAPDVDLPSLAETDIISSRAPAQRNAAPTDIQPGEPSP